jgi:hypothetical protein
MSNYTTLEASHQGTNQTVSGCCEKTRKRPKCRFCKQDLEPCLCNVCEAVSEIALSHINCCRNKHTICWKCCEACDEQITDHENYQEAMQGSGCLLCECREPSISCNSCGNCTDCCSGETCADCSYDITWMNFSGFTRTFTHQEKCNIHRFTDEKDEEDQSEDDEEDEEDQSEDDEEDDDDDENSSEQPDAHSVQPASSSCDDEPKTSEKSDVQSVQPDATHKCRDYDKYHKCAECQKDLYPCMGGCRFCDETSALLRKHYNRNNDLCDKTICYNCCFCCTRDFEKLINDGTHEWCCKWSVENVKPCDACGNCTKCCTGETQNELENDSWRPLQGQPLQVSSTHDSDEPTTMNHETQDDDELTTVNHETHDDFTTECHETPCETTTTTTRITRIPGLETFDQKIINRGVILSSTATVVSTKRLDENTGAVCVKTLITHVGQTPITKRDFEASIEETATGSKIMVVFKANTGCTKTTHIEENSDTKSSPDPTFASDFRCYVERVSKDFFRKHDRLIEEWQRKNSV